jgi:hypothetical protein
LNALQNSSKTLVYNKLNKLEMSYDCKKDKNNLINWLHSYDERNWRKKLNLKTFESVLKKYKFINEIKIFVFKLQLNDRNRVLGLISENSTFNNFSILMIRMKIKNFISKCG